MHRAPMTAMASGRSMSAPEPMPYASGSMPSAAASEVIRTGRKPAPAGTDQGFVQGNALAAEVFDEIEHQDAVLGHDADADDGAQERDDVQRSAR